MSAAPLLVFQRRSLTGHTSENAFVVYSADMDAIEHDAHPWFELDIQKTILAPFTSILLAGYINDQVAEDDIKEHLRDYLQQVYKLSAEQIDEALITYFVLELEKDERIKMVASEVLLSELEQQRRAAAKVTIKERIKELARQIAELIEQSKIKAEEIEEYDERLQQLERVLDTLDEEIAETERQYEAVKKEAKILKQRELNKLVSALKHHLGIRKKPALSACSPLHSSSTSRPHEPTSTLMQEPELTKQELGYVTRMFEEHEQRLDRETLREYGDYVASKSAAIWMGKAEFSSIQEDLADLFSDEDAEATGMDEESVDLELSGGDIGQTDVEEMTSGWFDEPTDIPKATGRASRDVTQPMESSRVAGFVKSYLSQVKRPREHRNSVVQSAVVDMMRRQQVSKKEDTVAEIESVTASRAIAREELGAIRGKIHNAASQVGALSTISEANDDLVGDGDEQPEPFSLDI